MMIFGLLFRRPPPPTPTPAPAPVAKRARARDRGWTAEEDRAVREAAAVPAGARMHYGETPIQAVARQLGRSTRSVRSRRHRLAGPAHRENLARARSERDRRDQAVIEMIEGGASILEGAKFAGVTRARIWKMLRAKAPDLTPRQKRNRIARVVGARVLDAHARGVGLSFSASEIEGLLQPRRSDPLVKVGPE